ncbi:MAG: hypothetical protein NC340_04910 [Ruminococcus flavefaciens]|nr:hypothetical protein [Ruminococcus flavefaciens]MCM1228995.1 hypothetical protein [Ruminococcus flavefaciens]
MNIIEKIKAKFLKNNFSLAILSVIIAVIAWFYISMTQYPTVPKTIEHIPVSLDISGTSAGLNGLSVISCDVKDVTVELLGSRTQVGNLNNENLEAYFDAENVSATGTKKLSIKIRNKSGIKYEVKSVSPSSATIVFDKMDTREFDIYPQIPNVSVVNGKEINIEELSCEPSVVRITGPSAQLDKISKCYAVSKKNMSLDSSYVLTNDEIQLYTEDNVLIDQSALTFSNTNFNITIPVRTQKEVKLSVIINAPDNFDKSKIKLNLSADSIILACNNSQTVIPDTLDIGVISLNELKPGFSKMFTINTSLENSEYINVSELETVTVTLDDEGLAQKDLTIDQNRISISNIPDSSYEYKVLTQRMNITVVGSEESVNAINAEDIIADINLLNTNVTTEHFNANVTFSCPTYDDVWVITNSKASVQRTKTEPATTSDESADLTD